MATLESYDGMLLAASVIGKASQRAAAEVLSMHQHRVVGREEEITAQLAAQVTIHLLDYVRKELQGKTFSGVRFHARVFKKNEEKAVGADLAGILQLEINGVTVTKAYLAQAKIGTYERKTNGKILVKCSDERLPQQVDNMLKLTSAAFVFVYTAQGVFVVPAFDVQLSGRRSIRADEYFGRPFGDFYKEFLTCFVGDHRLWLSNSELWKLPGITQDVPADAALVIDADVPQSPLL